ncbi:MAG: PAS domain S-box protein [Gammaproteobacteria bacterium]|nr:MAG: PAS domain S-box protein [Gammaproteobacteria bacterium]
MIIDRKKSHKLTRLQRVIVGLSIQTKLALIILSASILVMATGFASIIYWDIKSIRDGVQKESQTVVSVLGKDIAKLFIYDSVDSAADMVTSFRSFPNIENAIIYDNGNAAVFHYKKEDSYNNIAVPEIGENGKLYRDGPFLMTFLPISYQDDELGTICLRLSTEEQKEKIFGYIKVVLLMIPLLLVLSTFISIKFQRIFSAPILRLAKVVKRVSATHNYSDRLTFDDRNEIGELYDGFNMMLEQIDKNTSKLESVKSEIEDNNIELTKLNQHLEEQKFALDQAAKVSMSNEDGEITYVNDQFCSLSGYEKEELIGKSYRVIRSGFHTEEFFKNIKKVISEGKVWRGEIQNRNKNGSHYWVYTTIVPLNSEESGKSQYLAIHFDISDKKEAERSLRDAKEMAEAAVMAQTDFVSTLSQELRSPMRSLLDMLAVILNSNLTEEQTQRISLAHKSAEALLTLFNGILDYSRILAGSLKFEKVEFVLRTAINDVIVANYDQAHNKGVFLNAVYSSSLAHHVKGDPARIKEVLFTVLSIVLGFARDETVTIYVYPEHSQYDKQLVKFDIRSSDLKISPNIKIRLLNAFRRIDGSIAQVFSGAGMGPALSRQLIKLMGGDFGIGDSSISGSNFWFTVDLEGVQKQNEISIYDDMENPELKTLLVCDESITAEAFIKSYKGDEQHLVHTATISEALEALRLAVVHNVPFDMMVFDLNLPLNVVLEAGKSIAEDAVISHICMVLVCAPSQRGDAEKVKAAGFKGYFTKPIHLKGFTDDLRFVWHMRESNEILVTRHMCVEYGASKKRRLLIAGGNEESALYLSSQMSRYEFIVDYLEKDEGTIREIACGNHYDMVIIIFDDKESVKEIAASVRYIDNKGHPLPVLLYVSKEYKEMELPENSFFGVDDIIEADSEQKDLLDLFHKWLNKL